MTFFAEAIKTIARLCPTCRIITWLRSSQENAQFRTKMVTIRKADAISMSFMLCRWILSCTTMSIKFWESSEWASCLMNSNRKLQARAPMRMNPEVMLKRRKLQMKLLMMMKMTRRRKWMESSLLRLVPTEFLWRETPLMLWITSSFSLLSCHSRNWRRSWLRFRTMVSWDGCKSSRKKLRPRKNNGRSRLSAHSRSKWTTTTSSFRMNLASRSKTRRRRARRNRLTRPNLRILATERLPRRPEPPRPPGQERLWTEEMEVGEAEEQEALFNEHKNPNSASYTLKYLN